jgi:hypothetical protein
MRSFSLLSVFCLVALPAQDPVPWILHLRTLH